jgi:hypothetical protein
MILAGFPALAGVALGPPSAGFMLCHGNLTKLL